MTLTYVQIGSWNIEHLSKAGGRSESPYALADHIEMAGINVLALQEVYDTTPLGGDRRNRDLDSVCRLLHEHSGESWAYELYPNAREDEQKQLTGVLWNTTMLQKSDAYSIEVPYRSEGHSIWYRRPHATKFSAPYGDDTKSFVLVPVHMKSNYDGEWKGRQVREREARTLVEQLPAVRDHFREESLIVMGDTNILDRHEKAIDHFQEAGLRDLNGGDTATYPGYGGSPFDRALVAEGRPEFRFTRQYVLQSTGSKEHDKYLSDHYMIKISVKLYVDEADPR